MHCNPWVLVKAGSREDAVESASAWLDEQLEGDCPYDYGNPVAEDEDRDAEDKSESVIMGGTDKFREVVKNAIGTERRVLREHWDVTKQFVNAYDEPPGGIAGDDAEFKAKYKVGWGMGPGELLKAGSEVDQTLPAWSGYWHAGKMDKIRQHMDGRDCVITADAALYDLREGDDKCSPVEAGSDSWLVLLDCHF